MGVLRFLNSKGDEPVLFDLEKPDTVAQARKVFAETVGRGTHTAIAVVPGKPEDATVVREFDPQVEETVIFRQMVGG